MLYNVLFSIIFMINSGIATYFVYTWIIIKKMFLNMIIPTMQKIIKQIEIKNRTYYFFNDMISLKDFESNLLKIDKKSYKNIVIYNIRYITIKKIDDYESIFSVNPFYFQVNHANGFIKEKNRNNI